MDFSEPQEDYGEFLDLLHGLPAGVTEDRTGWSVTDDGSADYALRKLGALQASQAKRAAYVAAEIERLQAWAQHEDAQDQRGIDFFTSHLSRYADQLVADGTIHAKRKSYKLPHGTLSFRAKATAFEVTNQDEFLRWAQRTDTRFVRSKVEVDWASLKAALVLQADQTVCAEIVNEETGEVASVEVYGLRVKSPAHDEFQAKPSID